MRFTDKIKLAILPFGLVAGLASCSDFLDKEPDERVTINTEDQVLSLLTGSYPTGNYGPICELSSDNLVDNNAPHYDEESKKTVYYNLVAYDRRDEEIFRFEPVKSNEAQDSPTYIWQSYYQSIASVNEALQSIDRIVAANGGVMTEKLKAARAEALLIRAYSHFILVNVFSQAYKDPTASKQDIGIPYMTKPEDKVHVDYDRGNVADVYEKIEKDLEEGLKDVTDAYYQKPKWHFNVNAAHAFAARFYLYKRDYNKVIEHANAVLGTDRSQLPSMLMKYDGFSKCVSSSDYANVWQNPQEPNNLMLLSTMSLAARHLSGGVRFAVSSTSASQVILRTGPTWNWTILPCAMVSGLFVNGDQDYGLIQGKIIERFEYSDKVSGTGYPHVIRREFTCNQLLLDRIEAELLSPDKRDIPGAVADLIAYEESRQTLSEDDKKYYANNNGLRSLTEKEILSYYKYRDGRKTQNPGVYENWDFTQNMSAEFVVPQDVVIYMNCMIDFRRYESLFDGYRFFDLKRFGLEYSHIYGKNETEYKMVWNDPRRAIEVPQKTLSAGLESSQPMKPTTQVSSKSQYRKY